MSSYFIADDLSGALDAAAAFHHAGRRVVIALSPGDWPDVGEDTVVGLTTETRNADAATAQAAVRAVVAQGQARGATLVYKKIDSTLRGQVAAELVAIVEVLRGTRILLAAANPVVGRTTRDGVLYVNGVPVHETPFGRDPKSPLRTSRIADLLGELPGAAAIAIPDIEQPADFETAVNAMDSVGGPWLAVGSGGLVHAIAGACPGSAGVRPAGLADTSDRMQAGPENQSSKRETLNAKPETPILLLAGSAHPLNRTQIDVLMAARPVDRHVLDASVREADGASVSGAVGAGLPRDCTCPGSRGKPAPTASPRSLVLQLPAARLDPTLALDALVTAAVEHLQRTGTRHVFATGGETAFALCERLGIRSLEYLAELEPGLALARAESPAGPLQLAVKPGGFGDEQTWIRAYDALTNSANPANAPE